VLDLRWVVENRAAVEKMLADRGSSWASLAEGQGGADPWALDGERRKAIQEGDALRHQQRVCGEEIARRGRAKEDASALKAEMKQVADSIKVLEARTQEIEDKIRNILLVVPNVPDASVPVGRDEKANVEVRRVGEPRRFEFTPKSHWDLGPEMGLLDFERAARISGARFTV
jgi:seryl-tRNA synthetase